MDKKITIDVKHVAGLAALALTPGEEAQLGGELRETMAWLGEKLQAVDVEGVEPTIHGVAFRGAQGLPTPPWRPDTPQPSLDREAVFAQAPDRLNDEFKMPRIVE